MVELVDKIDVKAKKGHERGTVIEYREYIDTLEDYVPLLIKKTNSILPKIKVSKINRYELGIDISEGIVARYILPIKFGCIERRMPTGNRGYDFLVRGGYKINVKSSILTKNRWSFEKKFYGYMSDYFLCIGYDNKVNRILKIRHIWLIKNDGEQGMYIYNSPKSLLEFQKYENFL